MPLRDLHSISVWLKIALACSSLGVIFFIVGFATNSWMVQSYLYYNKWQTRGLWKFKSCTGHTCQLSSYNSYYLQDFHKATQAMECIGLIALLLAFLLLVLFIFVDACRRREAILSTIFFLFAAVVFMVTGFAIFAVKYEKSGFKVGWSMGLAIVGCIFTFVAAIMCVLQRMSR